MTLHFQKLGLQLKCVRCKPTLLPCDHIVCKFCLLKSCQSVSQCPTCKLLFVDKEIRPAPYLENIITIYKSLEAAFNTSNFLDGSNDSREPFNRSTKSVDNKRRKKLNEVEPHASDLGSRDRSSGTYRAKRSLGYDFNTPWCEMAGRTFSQDPSRAHDSRKQKKQNCELSESVGKGHASSPDNKEVSSCNGESHDAPEMDRTVCAFCHTSKQTEWTGPLLYYAKGKEVVGDVTAHPKAIPVHSKCIEWASQIYYAGETMKNLESELARAAKLKCNKCGLKGAALGCFVKSCRKTYHVPCAVEVSDCRWDCEDFLMLCPVHESNKFPREKLKRRKLKREKWDSFSKKMSSDKLKFWEASPTGSKEWFFCGSSLSSEEKYLLVKFAIMCGATVFNHWNPKVTHVIAATNTKGQCSRSFIVLMAILSGQ